MTNSPQTQKEFVLALENRPGTIAEVATALGKANINIVGFLMEAQGEFGVARIVTNDATKTESWLKQANRQYRAHEIITVPIKDQPGELGRLTSALAKSGVNVTAAYPTATPSGIGITFAVDDLNTARKVLQS